MRSDYGRWFLGEYLARNRSEKHRRCWRRWTGWRRASATGVDAEQLPRLREIALEIDAALDEAIAGMADEAGIPRMRRRSIRSWKRWRTSTGFWRQCRPAGCTSACRENPRAAQRYSEAPAPRSIRDRRPANGAHRGAEGSARAAALGRRVSCSQTKRGRPPSSSRANCWMNLRRAFGHPRTCQRAAKAPSSQRSGNRFFAAPAAN